MSWSTACRRRQTEETGWSRRTASRRSRLRRARHLRFTTTLTFAEGGGTQSVFIDRPSECAVSETPPAGCTLSSIDPVTTEIEEPILYPVTVSNNCDPAVEPAAAVVEVQRFTG